MKYYLGYNVCTWRGSTDKFKVKSVHLVRDQAVAAKKRAEANYPKHLDNMPRYRVVSEVALKAEEKMRQLSISKTRKDQAIRSGQKRKEQNAAWKKENPNLPSASQINRILCPTCKAGSKKLYSEMGGLQTRVCKNGHRFEYDKWIADRAFWNPAAAIGLISKRIP